MTAEEAIIQIKKHGIADKTGFSDEVDIEAEKIAIEALEKQVPQKVIVKRAFDFLRGKIGTDKLCPTCSRPVRWIDYPCRCGQMLDWSEVKEQYDD